MYLNYKSKIFLELDEIDKAIAYNNKAIEEDEEYAKAYIIKAEILCKLYEKEGTQTPSKLYEAIEQLSKAITLTEERENIEQINLLKSRIEKELTG
jgi:tetratricopeptide (TPR) repeat protein